MRVVQVTRFGGPEVLVARDAPDPVAGPGEVVVAVSVAPVLFVETQIRRGWGGDFFAVKPPYVPGNAAAGRVISVGSGVDSTWIGRDVVTRTIGGGYAEQALAASEELIPVPGENRLHEAAALLQEGKTALGLVERAQLRRGESVLVLAAGGGLGILLVQLAHAAGTLVVGAARGQLKLDLVRQLGADATVDYSAPGWPEAVREAIGGNGPDVVFDGVGGEIGRAAFELMPRGGRFSAHGAAGGGLAKVDPQEAVERGVDIRRIADAVFSPQDAKRLAERALSEAAAGRLMPVIGQTFPLERAADAHAAIEARSVIGKTLLIV